MKPTISRAGYLISKKNDFMKKVLMGKQNDSYQKIETEEDEKPPTPLHIKIQRAMVNNNDEMLYNKKRVEKGTFVFKTKERSPITLRNTDSPPPGRYTPHYDYLYKNVQNIVFNKAKSNRINKIQNSKVDSLDYPKMIGTIKTAKSKAKGFSFTKETRGYSLNHEDNRDFLNFDVLNKSENNHKAPKFENYTKRKSLFKFEKYLPDYKPKISFLSKPII